MEFDGAMSHAKVYLNGEYVGEWPYGYASFGFDLTPHVNLGKKNIWQSGWRTNPILRAGTRELESTGMSGWLLPIRFM